MAQDNPGPTQQTKPAKGKPVAIPIPKKVDVLNFLEKVAKTPDPEDSDAGSAKQ